MSFEARHGELSCCTQGGKDGGKNEDVKRMKGKKRRIVWQNYAHLEDQQMILLIVLIKTIHRDIKLKEYNIA